MEVQTSLTSTKSARAICWADGVIEILPIGKRLPRGAIAFAAGDEGEINKRVDVAARHARRGGFRLVPGVPEASTGDDAIDALVAWQERFFPEFIGDRRA